MHSLKNNEREGGGHTSRVWWPLLSSYDRFFEVFAVAVLLLQYHWGQEAETEEVEADTDATRQEHENIAHLARALAGTKQSLLSILQEAGAEARSQPGGASVGSTSDANNGALSKRMMASFKKAVSRQRN